MPINPNIILGIQQPNFDQPDPLERAGKSLALKGLMGQQEMQAMQMQQARQAAADEAGVRSDTIAAGGDSKALRALLTQRGAHKQIQALDKFELEKQEKESTIGKNKAATSKSEFDVQMGKLERGAALLDSARDQGSWDQALRIGAMTGVFAPEFVEQVSQQPFNPQVVRQLQHAGMTRAQQLADERARETSAETRRGNLVRETETGRHNVRTEGISAGNLGVAQANLGLSRQRLDYERTQGRAPSGYRFDSKGNLEAIPGGPAQMKEDKTTDVERISAGYASRMVQSGRIIDDLEKTGVGKPGFVEAAARGAGAETVANTSTMGDPNRQKYRQAQEDWVRAKLRKESGAVIAKDEMDAEIRVYFPMIGDSAEAVKQKADSRKVAQEAMKQGAGRAPVNTGSGASGGWGIKPL